MAISNVNGTNSLTDAPIGTNPKGVLGKDDFMKLLLVELQYQDPTEPMDSEKILSQTSQLATLESASNTNKALDKLAKSLAANRDFSTIGAIGKIADTGSNAIVFEEGQKPMFELYFADEVKNGTVEIMDVNGNVLRTLSIDAGTNGIAQFEWDGTDTQGDTVEEGTYYVSAKYETPSGESKKTRVGLYPIESVKFGGDETLVKIGSNYVPFSAIKEVRGA